ncbi:MAG: MotA/TolQ/ExbB proton channel family protein [Candidatus Omnitrophica bacterium]|nr:MotA/TolQ/ExbB proton channel family protein [Candidatus Omnitrophota bacterium]
MVTNVVVEGFIKGGPVMWPLLGCSIAALALIAERAAFWWRFRRQAQAGEIAQFFEQVRHGRLKEILRGREAANPIVQTLARALGHGDRALHDALELEVDATVERTRASLAGLDTCITLAPLLGIFGTVTGIIGSFNLIGQTAIADPQAVSAGIAEALITTAAGLTIAMPTLVCYNLFLTFSDRIAFRLEKYAREFEILYAQAKGLPAADPRHPAALTPADAR